MGEKITPHVDLGPSIQQVLKCTSSEYDITHHSTRAIRRGESHTLCGPGETPGQPAGEKVTPCVDLEKPPANPQGRQSPPVWTWGNLVHYNITHRSTPGNLQGRNSPPV